MPKITHPLWYFDRKFARKHPSVVGVDEAGRGPFAGPVVAAAAHLSQAFYANRAVRKQTQLFNDSKQLKPEQREAFFAVIVEWVDAGLLQIAHGVGSIEEIECYNILGATRLCMERALNQLKIDLLPNGGVEPLFYSQWETKQTPAVLVDGKPLHPFPWQHQAIVQGDGKSLAIAIASIYAKVIRDRMMADYAREYPGYAFERNKGYGTQEHCKAILAKGVCPIHRPSFLKKLFAHNTTSPEQTKMFTQVNVQSHS